MVMWTLMAAALAAVPGETSYSGRLLDVSGDPIQGALTLDFSLYDAASGGIALWTEQHTPTLESGYFSVILGREQPLTADLLDGPRWIGVQPTDGSGELMRSPLAAVPTAVLASRAAGAAHADVATDLAGGTVDATAVSTPHLSVGTYQQTWSLRVGGRGSGAADDLWWLGTIDADDYDNAGLIIEACSASRWNGPGCQTTYVAFGHYSGNPSQPAGDEYSVTQVSTSPSPYRQIPIVTAFQGSPVGQRRLAVYARVGSPGSRAYENVAFSIRGLGRAHEFIVGDGSLVNAGSVTLNP